MSKAGRRIIEGLKQAVAGDFARVTIDGQVWIREPRWQPIETAPRDGTPVLIICHWPWATHKSDGEQIAVCWRHRDAWFGGPSSVPEFKPTAWQPLPAAKAGGKS